MYIPEREVLTPTLRRLLRNKGAQFLKGPISVDQIAVAGALPGHAPLLVWLAIQYRRDVCGRPWVTLPPAVMVTFGFDRHIKKRGLKELEHAGLIRTRRVSRVVEISLAPNAGPRR